MIDQKNKVIYNGYGTLSVGVDQERKAIRVYTIKKNVPLEPGQRIKSGEAEAVEGGTIEFLSPQAFTIFYEAIHKINENNRIVCISGWEHNFENFHQGSVDVWRNAVNILLDSYIGELNMKEGENNE